MNKSRGEVAVLWGCVLLFALVYATDPFHTGLWNPLPRVYGIATFRMPSRSMEPTIAENTIFLLSEWRYVLSEPRAGDIVVFRYPPDPTVMYVKRVIAGGGSTVEIAEGTVLVDGRPLSEKYLVKGAASTAYSRVLPRIRVPPRCYFVMGDNRDHSEDSRAWGFVPRDHILGRVGPTLLSGR